RARVTDECVVRRGPVRPGERGGEPLGAVLVEAPAAVRPPGLPAERPVQAGAGARVEQEVVDLMAVLVLDQAPGGAAVHERAPPEPDLPGGRVARAAGDEVDRHVTGHSPPVKGARGQGGAYRLSLAGGPAGERVAPGHRLRAGRIAGDDEREDRRRREDGAE